MRACIGGVIAGALVALLILAVGIPVAVTVAIGLSVLAIGVGAVDYVKTRDEHGRRRG